MKNSLVRMLLPAAFTLVGLSAQSPDQLLKLQDLTDRVKVSLQRGDLETANRLSSELMIGIYTERKSLEPSPQQKLAKLEQDVPPTAVGRFYALSKLAQAAFDAGDWNKAENYARELLSLAPVYQKNWNDGNAIFYGNMVLGRVALHRDRNVAFAKSYLLASAQTVGSPQLNSFGPNMSLAKDLLDAGERDTTLEFFTLCRRFWKLSSPRLDDWTAMVKGGGNPNFGANLLY